MPTPEIDAAAAGTWTLGDLTVRRMGFGSMRITANPDRDLAIQVLRRAVDLGVNHIDTAAFYVSPGGTLRVGTGTPRYATELIRDALSPYPEDLVIATKVGPGGETWASTAVQLRSQVEENLRRLGRDHLDLVNLRLMSPRQEGVAEQWGALARMREEGLIRHLGLSVASLDHVDELQPIAPVLCLQNSYGVDYRRNNDHVVQGCRQRGVAFVPFFALAGQAREKGAGDTDHGEQLRAVAAAHGVTPEQVRLAWTLQQGPHVLAIPGTGSVAHLEENVAAAALRLTDEELAVLQDAARR
jgi:pyridoxine 4-dehydrogenase